MLGLGGRGRVEMRMVLPLMRVRLWIVVGEGRSGYILLDRFEDGDDGVYVFSTVEKNPVKTVSQHRFVNHIT